MPLPFIGQTFTFSQPDGSRIVLRGTGNQYAARFETEDGLPVMRDPTSGFWHLARLSPDPTRLAPGGVRPGTLSGEVARSLDWVLDAVAAPNASAAGGLERSGTRWEQRRQERRSAAALADAYPDLRFAPPQRHTVGAFVGLTLLIAFPDVPGTVSREEVDAFCNGPGYAGFGKAGSVRDYYHDVSDGRLDYTNVVAPWFTASKPRDYYTNEQVAQPARARELILEAIAHHKATGFHFSHLTADDKGYVYAVNAFYAGDRVNNWAQGLWPHSFHLDRPVELAQGRNAFDYQVTNMGDELTLGTFCHENGHMICDFPDLYDYGGESSGVGSFCLMCGGGAAAFEKNPAQVGAYLKQAAGWASEVHDLAAAGELTLPTTGNAFAELRRSRTEYFLVENRLASGRDAGLPGSGILVWHVDEKGNNSDEQMTPARHYECSIVQADGRTDLERGRGQGDAGDLFRAGGVDRLDAATLTTRWWDGTASGLTLSAIGAAGAAVTLRSD